MSYIKAHDVLPDELIKLVQEYIDGDCIYIPRKTKNKKSWGEKNGVKDTYKKRNAEIFDKYTKGVTIIELTNSYYLSEKSIRRIIRAEEMKR